MQQGQIRPACCILTSAYRDTVVLWLGRLIGLRRFQVQYVLNSKLLSLDRLYTDQGEHKVGGICGLG